MLQPISDMINQFKTVPDKIRSVVDIDGAAAGMYAQMGKISLSLDLIKANMVSSEAPITLNDYRADPSRYENLMAIEHQTNNITEEDCLSSGYTKVVWTFNEEYIKKLLDQFPAPQDRDIVGK